MRVSWPEHPGYKKTKKGQPYYIKKNISGEKTRIKIGPEISRGAREKTMEKKSGSEN